MSDSINTMPECLGAVERLKLAYGFDEESAWEEVNIAYITEKEKYMRDPRKTRKYDLNREGRRLIWDTIHVYSN